MGKISIKKNTVQETLIIPLYARKLGNEFFPHLLQDPYADAAASRLDYDFSALDKGKHSFLWKFGALEGILRSIDREINIAADLHSDSWMDRLDASCGIFLFAAGVFMYFREEEVRRLVLRLKASFPHGCLVFDTVGKLAVKVLMKKTLEKMGITSINGIFCCNNPLHDLRWDDGINLSVRKYLTGYVDLKQESVPPHLRGMASLFDRLFRMNICRMTW